MEACAYETADSEDGVTDSLVRKRINEGAGGGVALMERTGRKRLRWEELLTLGGPKL